MSRRNGRSALVFVAASHLLVASVFAADGCSEAMNEYFNLHLFDIGKAAERTRFLVKTRSNFSFPSGVEAQRCKGLAYAWELFSHITRDVPAQGSDWSLWHWREPLKPIASALSAQFMLSLKNVSGARAIDPDYDTFTLVHFNASAARHAREKMLDAKVRNAAHDAGIRYFREFPAGATTLKSIWRRVPANGCISLGIWDGLKGSDTDGFYDDSAWPRHVVVYDSDGDEPSSGCTQAPSQDMKISAQKNFVLMRITNATLLSNFKRFPASSNLAQGDLLILVGLHVARKDMPDWAWVTLYWKYSQYQTTQEKLGRDEVIPVDSVWSNYLLNYSLSFRFPLTDGSPNYVFNPYLEGGKVLRGTQSNCVGCHAKARYSRTETCAANVPTILGRDTMLYLFESAVTTDYSWTSAMPINSDCPAMR